MASGTGRIPTENQFPWQTLVAGLSQTPSPPSPWAQSSLLSPSPFFRDAAAAALVCSLTNAPRERLVCAYRMAVVSGATDADAASVRLPLPLRRDAGAPAVGSRVRTQDPLFPSTGWLPTGPPATLRFAARADGAGVVGPADMACARPHAQAEGHGGWGSARSSPPPPP